MEQETVFCVSNGLQKMIPVQEKIRTLIMDHFCEHLCCYNKWHEGCKSNIHDEKQAISQVKLK